MSLSCNHTEKFLIFKNTLLLLSVISRIIILLYSCSPKEQKTTCAIGERIVKNKEKAKEKEKEKEKAKKQKSQAVIQIAAGK